MELPQDLFCCLSDEAVATTHGRAVRGDFARPWPSRSSTDGADLISMDHSASALRTSDWEIPKCRAIRDGVTPALKAARTALIFAWGNETAAALTGRFGEVSADTAGFLPRRSCSASTAASNRSSSPS